MPPRHRQRRRDRWRSSTGRAPSSQTTNKAGAKMRRSIPTGLAGLAAGVLLLGATACGGDDDGGPLDTADEPDTTTVPDTPTETEPEGGELTAYCEAALGIESTPPFEGETDAEAL